MRPIPGVYLIRGTYYHAFPGKALGKTKGGGGGGEPPPAPVSVDSVNPHVVIESPPDGTTTSATNIIVTGSAADDYAVAKVEVHVDGGTYYTATNITGNWSDWSIAINNLLAGATHDIQARATDTSGNQSWHRVYITILPAPIAPAPAPIPAPAPTPTPTPTLDRFGVLMKYPSKLYGEQWFMNTSNILNDSRVIPSSSITSVITNPDGSLKVRTSGDVDNRFNILTSGGYDHSKCVLNWNTLLQRGYMQNPQDWRNVEITAYARINQVYAVSGHSLVWYARGGHHSLNYPCEGCAYKGNILYNGDTRFQKEMGHPNYFPTSSTSTPLSGNILGRWFGYKFCLYDLAGGDVKMENWLDVNMNNTWVKVRETTDSKLWGSNPSGCGGVADQKFLWGGPQAVFRFDSTNDIDFAKMSVREIKP